MITLAQKEVLSRIAAIVHESNASADRRGHVIRLHLPIGGGRTAIDLLLPCAVEGCRTALILVPPASVRFYWDQHDRLRQEKASVSTVIFADAPCTIMPGGPTAHVVSKNILSRPDGMQWLNDLKPDLIVFDEPSPNSARAYRIGEYVRKNPSVTVVEWMTRAGES